VTPVTQMGVRAAIGRARTLAEASPRSILGITGPPGAGKSTLAALVVGEVARSVLVGMDAFHLAHSSLERLGRGGRKGAPDTFDAAGYVALLERLRTGADGTVWAPEFRREIEDAVCAAVAVEPTTRLVVTEGNYLLLEDGPWALVRPLLDEVWYVDVPPVVRRLRLARRHERFGRSPAAALHRTLGSDEDNAVLVVACRERADVVVDLDRPGEADRGLPP